MVRWPLRHNKIRRGLVNHTFGMVRNGGTRAHQGWDLYAEPGTPCFAIADGEIVFAEDRGAFGNLVVLKFCFRGATRYAAYAHLSTLTVTKDQIVPMGQLLGDTGNTGNATSMTGDDQHLHFEIRTLPMPGLGLGGRICPSEVYGEVPFHGVSGRGPEIYENCSKHAGSLTTTIPSRSLRLNILSR